MSEPTDYAEPGEWRKPPLSRFRHWFYGGKSACGEWHMPPHALEPVRGLAAEGDCPACAKKLTLRVEFDDGLAANRF